MSEADNWLAEAKSVVMDDVLAEVGYEVRRRTTDCPSCGEQRRGRADRRRPVGMRRDGLGWQCMRCSVKGDGPAFVAYALTQKPVCRENIAEVRAWYAARGWCEPEVGRPVVVRAVVQRPPPVDQDPTYPPPDELRRLLGLCVPVKEARDEGLAAFLRARGWPDDVGAGWLADGGWRPSWWRWPGYGLVVPAWTADGRLASMHARTVYARSPKTRWPSGYQAGGLLFANIEGRALLRWESRSKHVLICEGVTDTLRASSQAPPGFPVLGGASGAWSALADVRWPAGAKVAVAMDLDGTGRRYQDAIRAAVPGGVEVRPWAMWRRTPAEAAEHADEVACAAK